MSGTSETVDFLIIGQGLAGSLLAWFLDREGKRVHIVDNDHIGASSTLAAGIINPVTGRRLVKSWMIDELLPFANTTYKNIEQHFNASIYKQRTIYRALNDIKSENQWDERSGDDGYTDYLGAEQPDKKVQETMNPPFSWGAVNHAAQVDVPLFLNLIKQYFIDKTSLTVEDLIYDELNFTEENTISYKKITAKQVVFCEGQRARFNPWFKELPFVVSKGEMLEIAIPDATDFPIIKHKAYIVPLKENRFWVGATNEWNELNNDPTEKAKQQLLKQLDQSVVPTYTVLKHNAAIRPTVKDRRPFLGSHDNHPNLHIFNGLGTKGTSLGPYWGSHFVAYLLGRTKLNEEVDIKRFSK